MSFVKLVPVLLEISDASGIGTDNSSPLPQIKMIMMKGVLLLLAFLATANAFGT
jgi:hypothetical protein